MSSVEIEVRAPRAVDATPARWRGDAGHSPLDCHTGSDVLEIDPSSVKALFRQGKCYLALDKWDAAKESFRKVLELDDGNMEARRGLQSVRVSVCVKINERVRLTRRWRERRKFDFHTGQNASPKGEGEEIVRRQEVI